MLFFQFEISNKNFHLDSSEIQYSVSEHLVVACGSRSIVHGYELACDR